MILVPVGCINVTPAHRIGPAVRFFCLRLLIFHSSPDLPGLQNTETIAPSSECSVVWFSRTSSSVFSLFHSYYEGARHADACHIAPAHLCIYTPFRSAQNHCPSDNVRPAGDYIRWGLTPPPLLYASHTHTLSCFLFFYYTTGFCASKHMFPKQKQTFYHCIQSAAITEMTYPIRVPSVSIVLSIPSGSLLCHFPNL